MTIPLIEYIVFIDFQTNSTLVHMKFDAAKKLAKKLLSNVLTYCVLLRKMKLIRPPAPLNDVSQWRVFF